MVQEVRNHQKKTYLYEPESFRPLALVQDEEVYHYHLDHLGTPRELTNQGGHIVWKARYKTYGNVAVKEVDEIDNPIRFQGQYFDEETGLHYSRHRYYNPSTGQFTTQDPIGLLGGTNSYQYAPNPVQWIDPMGLTAQKEDPSRQMEAIARPRTQQSQLALPAPNESNPWMSGEPLIGDVVGDEGLNVYRAHGEGRATGGWVTLEAPPSQDYVRRELAVAPEWNDATYYSKIKLAPGTRIQSGIAGPQDFPGGSGGGHQLRVLNFDDILKQEVVETKPIPK